MLGQFGSARHGWQRAGQRLRPPHGILPQLQPMCKVYMLGLESQTPAIHGPQMKNPDIAACARLPASLPVQKRSATALGGCPVHDLRGKLRNAGLRPTRQRVALGWLLFARGDRHVTAEGLYEEAISTRVPISLATVYNTLHQFTQSGLLREIAVDGSKTFFDTNTSEHHHFLVEETSALFDIPGAHVEVGRLPDAPAGMEIARVDVIVRVRRKG